jgi:large subunit ribosomal protein L17
MRHRKKVNHLGRKSAHRKAMLSNMAASLILHKRINTTLAKAKALKVYVEPLITKSKDDSTHSRRVVFSYLENKYAVSELFRDVAQKVADRPGGYTRILKTGFRQGDGAEMCMIELVDYNPNLLKKAEGDQAKKTRRAGRRKKTEDETPVAKKAAPKAVKEEKPVSEQEADEPKAVAETQPEAQTPEAAEDSATPEESPDAETEK